MASFHARRHPQPEPVDYNHLAVLMLGGAGWYGLGRVVLRKLGTEWQSGKLFGQKRHAQIEPVDRCSPWGGWLCGSGRARPGPNLATNVRPRGPKCGLPIGTTECRARALGGRFDLTQLSRARPHYPAGGTAGAATARGRINSSMALAKPSSSFEAVT